MNLKTLINKEIKKMYTLYYSPATCSLATHVLLNELKQDFTLITKSTTVSFNEINPAETVPVLVDQGMTIQEGAAIALYLMEKHNSPLLPSDFLKRSKAIQSMLFANASIHPAYSKVFFISQNTQESEVKVELLKRATENVSRLWRIVNDQLSKNEFFNGDDLTMADIMLSVYANWNNFFPGQIELGSNSIRMIHQVSSRLSFIKAIESEKIKFKV